MEIYRREALTEILPHRGRMLLLDQVKLSSEKVIGELLVTDSVCEGHAVFDGKLILRGCDFYEIAAQLLAVYLALKFPELKKGITVVRKYGEAHFKDKVFPGEILTMELDPESIKVEEVEKLGYKIMAKNFVARVGDKVKSKISFVELFVFLKPQSTSD